LLNLRSVITLVIGCLAIWAIDAMTNLSVVAIMIVFVASVVILSKGSATEQSVIEDLRERNQAYVSLLDELPVGVYRITPEGRILEGNRKLTEILGYQGLQDLKNINVNTIYVNKTDRVEHLEKLRSATVFAESELRKKDGSTVWVRDYPKAVLNLDGKIEHIDGVMVETHGINAIVRGITEHKKLETMKDRFISAFTHELRTPLVSIKGYVDYILTKEPILPDGIKSKVEIVRRNTDRLLALTEDLLDFERVEAGRLELKIESFNLRQMLLQCIEEIQPFLKEKNQVIHFEAQPSDFTINGDRLRLSEALINLLHNATKFTPEAGEISVRAEKKDGLATVYVVDSGIGLDEKDLERVFEPFAVIEKPGYFSGTGLGLSLAKQMIEAHNGAIWATSPGKGRGTTFAFTLPYPMRELITVHG
jgi:PAS domain S-box-containing protein